MTQLLDIPLNLLVVIFQLLSDDGYVNIISAKKCCKAFKEACEDIELKRYVKVESFDQLMSWRNQDKYKSMFQKFLLLGNPNVKAEAALLEFFFCIDEAALHILIPKLDTLSEMQYMPASYALGLLLCIFYGREDSRGSSVLEFFIDGKNVQMLLYCRKNFDRILRKTWGNPKMHLQIKKGRLCTKALMENQDHFFSWPVYDEEVHELPCKDCAKDHLIRNITNGHLPYHSWYGN